MYWPILGSYNNWQTIHCVENRKQQKSTDTDINVHIEKNATRNIALHIGKYIIDNDYGAI